MAEGDFDKAQFVVPQVIFMTKEMEIKASMSYNDEDFRDSVKAFSSG